MKAKSESTQKAPAPAEEGPRPELFGLSGIVGQGAVVATLRGALGRDRPHHAYLFDGPEGVGKATCARALFAAMNCLDPPGPGDACGGCASCAKVRAGTHPDLIPFDMGLSGLADEAERLIRRLGYAPHEGRVQMVIFDPADNFSAPTALTAANRLLKTIEEPIARTHFVLVTSAASALLSTIRSRTQRLRFLPLLDEVLRQQLSGIYGVEAGLLEQVIKLAQGSLGRALEKVREADRLLSREQGAAALREAAEARRSGRIVDVAADIGQDRDEAQEVLELLWLRLHGELRGALAQGGLQADRLIRRLRLVSETTEAIRRYTSAPLALERMMRLIGAGTRDQGRAGGQP